MKEEEKGNNEEPLIIFWIMTVMLMIWLLTACGMKVESTEHLEHHPSPPGYCIEQLPPFPGIPQLSLLYPCSSPVEGQKPPSEEMFFEE